MAIAASRTHASSALGRVRPARCAIYQREGVQSRPELRGRLADRYPQLQPSRAAG